MNKEFSNETEFVFSSEFVGFTTIPNYILNDRRISYKALGMYVQILQFQNSPDNKIYISTLQSFKKDGRDSVASGLRELIKLGYLTKEQVRDSATGRIKGVRYTVYMKPCISSDSTNNGKADIGSEEHELSDGGKADNGLFDISKPVTYQENMLKIKYYKKIKKRTHEASAHDTGEIPQDKKNVKTKSKKNTKKSTSKNRFTQINDHGHNFDYNKLEQLEQEYIENKLREMRKWVYLATNKRYLNNLNC